jgi:hypothetical protein
MVIGFDPAWLVTVTLTGALVAPLSANALFGKEIDLGLTLIASAVAVSVVSL